MLLHVDFDIGEDLITGAIHISSNNPVEILSQLSNASLPGPHEKRQEDRFRPFPDHLQLLRVRHDLHAKKLPFLLSWIKDPMQTSEYIGSSRPRQ